VIVTWLFDVGDVTPVMSLGLIRNVTLPVSLKIVAQGESAEHGGGSVTIVSTSDMRKLDWGPAVAPPLDAVSDWMTRNIGDRPSRTTSPHDAPAAARPATRKIRIAERM
jgi:hypothetical protein